jgi:putative iron-dependent peroxidase
MRRQPPALVPSDHPGAGGSHVLLMRWVHDLTAFEALPTAEQERVFGRTKLDSIELEGAATGECPHLPGRNHRLLRRGASHISP